MSIDLTKRAEKLDNMRLKGMAEKLSLEEAENIVSVWGVHLEHMGGIRMLFGISIPESILPYPIVILQGALNKMEAYYHAQGIHDRVKLLESTEMELMQYTTDEEAIKEALTNLGNNKMKDVLIEGLKDYQKTQMENGYLVDKRLFKLSKPRIEELIKDI